MTDEDVNWRGKSKHSKVQRVVVGIEHQPNLLAVEHSREFGSAGRIGDRELRLAAHSVVGRRVGCNDYGRILGVHCLEYPIPTS
jgi:hypothetical protein